MPEITLTPSVLNSLLQKRSNLLMQQFPGGKSYIEGDEIMHISTHRQLGNFLLFQIYQDWNAQLAHSVRKYFDTETPAVKSAIRDFANRLSRHIRIEKEAFREMLEKALYNNVKLALHPEEMLSNFFFGAADRISLDIYKRYAAYFSDFDFAVQSLLKFFEKNEVNLITKTLFREKFAKVSSLFEKKEGKSIKSYQRNLFRQVIGESIDAFLEAEKVREVQPASKPTEHPTEPHSDPEAAPESKESLLSRLQQNNKTGEPSLSDKLKEKEVTPLHKTLSKESLQPENMYQQANNKKKIESEKEHPGVLAKEREEPETPFDLFSNQEDQDSKKLVQQYQQNAPSTSTVNKKLGSSNVLELSQIPVHKQFQYVQKLFGGSSVKFKIVLDKLGEVHTAAEAEGILDKYVFNTEEVDKGGKVAMEFLDLVRQNYEAS